MRKRVAIVYNEPHPSRYDNAHEEKAVLGVLEAVTAVHQALLELGYEVTLLPLVPPFEEARRKLAALNVDVVFNLFEGFCGEPETEALVPEALDGTGASLYRLPGSIIRLALDKAKVKVILKAAGIPTPDFQLLNPADAAIRSGWVIRASSNRAARMPATAFPRTAWSRISPRWKDR